MNQTAKNNNSKIKNNKELVLQSWIFTVRFTDSDLGYIQVRSVATYLIDH